MDERFENAPLVEIVAELRWEVPMLAGVDQSGNPAQSPFADPNAVEALFHRISVAVAEHGFDRLERVGVQGLPVFLPQMIYRYRRSDSLPVLMQVGPGQFSVNALPPYKSWTEFRPWLDKGVGALLTSVEGSAVLSANLRYIDAFRNELTEGRDAKAFLTEVLGFKLELPQALGARLADRGAFRSAMQVVLPMKGMQMGIAVSDGQFGGDSAILMDTNIQVEGPWSADKDAIMSAFDGAHELAHETFIDMTRSIRDKMQPATTSE
jgi:uncharacterized protein (TIGR04255 family)